MKIVKRIPAKNSVLATARWTCLEPMYLPDNVIGKCAECGHAIQYRPHAPKKIRKICTECAAPYLEEGDTKVITTQRMIDDATIFSKRQKH
jgi:hypothetical protein